MTPEAALVEHLGQALLHDICFVLTQSTLYGLYLAIFASGARSLLTRRSRTRYTWTLFWLLAVLFAIFTTNLAVQIAFLVKLIRGALLDNPDRPILEREQLASASTTVFGICLIWFSGSSGGGFLFVFADAVVVWRAWVLWSGNKIAKIVPVILLFASFGSVVASSTLDTLIQKSAAKSHTVPRSSLAGIILSLSLCLSLATNSVATTLIGCNAYRYRKIMRTSLGLQSSTVMSATILLFLTESGAVFCILQVIALSINMAENTLFSSVEYGAGIWAQFMIFAAAAYPVIVIIIVDGHRSILDHTSADSCHTQDVDAPSLGVGTHITFAPGRTPSESSGSGVGLGTTCSSDTVNRDDPGAQHLGVSASALQDVEKGGIITMAR